MFWASLASFFAGVLLASVFNISFWFSLVFAIVSLAFFIYYLFQLKNQNPKQRFNLCLGLVFLFLFIGLFRVNFAEHNVPIFPDNMEIDMVGTIISEADRRENNTHYVFETQKIGDLEIEEKILLFADSYPEYEYGDEISVVGKLKRPKNFETDSGRIFDYENYLVKDNIFYISYYPKIKLLNSGGGNFIKRNLFTLKNSFLEKISLSIPEPQASLAGGLILGAKQSLGEELLDDFRKTGIVHIVVLSGYNVTIIAEALMKMLSFVSVTLAPVIGIISIILFAILTGAGATIVRASIMATMVIVAKMIGRTSTGLRLLFVAGFVMVLFNPFILVFDLSFQLSFLATLGLILVSPILNKHLKFIPEHFGFREIIVATFSTQIFVLPLLMYSVGEVSLIAPIVNILVLIFIPMTMLLGFVAGAIGFLSSILALPIGYLAYVFLSYEIYIVKLFAQIPVASVVVPQISIWLVVFMYVAYLLFILKINKV